jgi:hypothetical protein
LTCQKSVRRDLEDWVPSLLVPFVKFFLHIFIFLLSILSPLLLFDLVFITLYFPLLSLSCFVPVFSLMWIHLGPTPTFLGPKSLVVVVVVVQRRLPDGRLCSHSQVPTWLETETVFCGVTILTSFNWLLSFLSWTVMWRGYATSCIDL